MAVHMNVDVTLDCRGDLCPIPVIRVRRALDGMQPKQILEVLATDPACEDDFPAFSRNTGHELLEFIEEDGVFRSFFRKAG